MTTREYPLDPPHHSYFTETYFTETQRCRHFCIRRARLPTGRVCSQQSNWTAGPGHGSHIGRATVPGRRNIPCRKCPSPCKTIRRARLLTGRVCSNDSNRNATPGANWKGRLRFWPVRIRALRNSWNIQCTTQTFASRNTAGPGRQSIPCRRCRENLPPPLIPRQLHKQLRSADDIFVEDDRGNRV
jgi:hypothetical protein